MARDRHTDPPLTRPQLEAIRDALACRLAGAIEGDTPQRASYEAAERWVWRRLARTEAKGGKT